MAICLVAEAEIETGVVEFPARRLAEPAPDQHFVRFHVESWTVPVNSVRAPLVAVRLQFCSGFYRSSHL